MSTYIHTDTAALHHIMTRLMYARMHMLLLDGPHGVGKSVLIQCLRVLLNVTQHVMLDGVHVMQHDASQQHPLSTWQQLYTHASHAWATYGYASDTYMLHIDNIEQHDVQHVMRVCDVMRVLRNVVVVATTTRKERMDEGVMQR